MCRPPAGHHLSLRKSTAILSTQAPLIQLLPIAIRVVHRNLTSRRYPPRDHQNPLLPAPVELLELTVRPAGMVDKSRKVAHLALEDLVCSQAGTANHHVDTLDAVCDEAGKFTNGGAAVNVLLALIRDTCKSGGNYSHYEL